MRIVKNNIIYKMVSLAVVLLMISASNAYGDEIGELEEKIISTENTIKALVSDFSDMKDEHTKIESEISDTSETLTSLESDIVEEKTTFQESLRNSYKVSGVSFSVNPNILNLSDINTILQSNVYSSNMSSFYSDDLNTLYDKQTELNGYLAELSEKLDEKTTLENEMEENINRQETILAELQDELDEAKAEKEYQQKLSEMTETVTSSSEEMTAYSTASSSQRDTAVAAALSQVGLPYIWGTEAPGVGFDCNSLTHWAWAQAGVSIPYPSGTYAYGQYQWMRDSGRWVTNINNMQPGDIVFYNVNGGHHCALYIGDYQVVHAIDTRHGIAVTSWDWCSGFAGGGSPI